MGLSPLEHTKSPCPVLGQTKIPRKGTTLCQTQLENTPMANMGTTQELRVWVDLAIHLSLGELDLAPKTISV